MNQIPKLLELARNIEQFVKTHLPGCRAKYAGILGAVLLALPWSARALIINVTYDPNSVTIQPNAAQIETAYNLVVQNLETLYTNPMTFNITVYWGNSDFGNSSTELEGGPSYSEWTSALQAAETTPEDSNAVASLPASDPIGSANWLIPRAEFKSLTQLANLYGIDPNDNVNDGSVYFASNGVTWTFNPTNRAVPGEYDFMAVAEHETTEAMGRIYCLDVSISGYYVPYDLFRFTNGVRTLYAFDSGVYLSINDGVTALKPFNAVTPSTYMSEDAQDWMPTNLVDSYDWELGPDVEGVLSSPDLTSLDILGYDLNFTAPKLKGTRLTNGNFDLTFTNVTGLGFTVWASTNLLSPANKWINVGRPTETSVGHYQLIDTSANKDRFYRVLLQ
ncbi:MAG TPA: NF038122 family metalloprotease [Verrucomicrobiae bacterium]|jgi:hypothetical protein